MANRIAQFNIFVHVLSFILGVYYVKITVQKNAARRINRACTKR